MSIKISKEDVIILNAIKDNIITEIDLLFNKNNRYEDYYIYDFLRWGIKT